MRSDSSVVLLEGDSGCPAYRTGSAFGACQVVRRTVSDPLAVATVAVTAWPILGEIDQCRAEFDIHAEFREPRAQQTLGVGLAEHLTGEQAIEALTRFGYRGLTGRDC